MKLTFATDSFGVASCPPANAAKESRVGYLRRCFYLILAVRFI
jgi:hypothetical protein